MLAHRSVTVTYYLMRIMMTDYFEIQLKNKIVEMNEPEYFTYRCYKSNFDLNKAYHAIELFRRKYETKNSEMMILLDSSTYDALVSDEQHIPPKIDGVSIITHRGASTPIVFFRNPEREFKRLRLEREKLNIANRNSDKFKVDIDY